ncbi:MAG: type III pantothenate kinase [Planctomycetales bacterium]|nr:type III pantothenate kinase [Planctomycetales bacterium]
MGRDRTVIAVDIGNSRIKIGRFETPAAPLPLPSGVLEVEPHGEPFEQRLAAWLTAAGSQKFNWVIASVNRSLKDRLVHCVGSELGGDVLRTLTFKDLNLRIDLPQPEHVGIDRLLAAVAANRLRDPQRPAAVIDIGTAITVDAVSAEGVFLGGAILPGIRMSARALCQQTDLLPDIELIQLEDPPTPIGKATSQAIHSGLFWGALGAVRELVARYTETLDAAPQVVLTGGAAPQVARLLSAETLYEPHLVLSGMALTAESM